MIGKSSDYFVLQYLGHANCPFHYLVKLAISLGFSPSFFFFPTVFPIFFLFFSFSVFFSFSPFFFFFFFCSFIFHLPSYLILCISFSAVLLLSIVFVLSLPNVLFSFVLSFFLSFFLLSFSHHSTYLLSFFFFFLLRFSSFYWAIDLMIRVFANGPVDRGSIPGRVLPKTPKMVLVATLLNTQHYKVRIKGKVEKSREWSSALPYTSL